MLKKTPPSFSLLPPPPLSAPLPWTHGSRQEASRGMAAAAGWARGEEQGAGTSILLVSNSGSSLPVGPAAAEIQRTHGSSGSRPRLRRRSMPAWWPDPARATAAAGGAPTNQRRRCSPRGDA
jgi:hypothetical protein